jgi:hypothetical protein
MRGRTERKSPGRFHHTGAFPDGKLVLGGLEGFAVRGLNRLPHFAVPFPGKIFRLYALRRNDRRISLAGKLDLLRIGCPTCGAQGRYHVARPLAELGPDYRLTDWLSERTADCPQKKSNSSLDTGRGVVPADLFTRPEMCQDAPAGRHTARTPRCSPAVGPAFGGALSLARRSIFRGPSEESADSPRSRSVPGRCQEIPRADGSEVQTA